MKINFQSKLILGFVVIFLLFSASIAVFEQRGARRYKTEALLEKLDAYAGVISRGIATDGGAGELDSLLMLMPSEMRVTLIDRSGSVVYDNKISEPRSLGSHAERPEIVSAINKGQGTDIRTSASDSTPYLYYAKDGGGGLITRVALPYDIHVQSFLEPGNAFLYFVIGLFIVGLGLIYYVAQHFGRSVKNLRDFSRNLEAGVGGKEVPEFPDDELGEIGMQLVGDMRRIRENERKLAQEREKLLLHIHTSAEGVCFFNPDRTVAFYNGLFVQYFNIISNHRLVTGRRLPPDPQFDKVAEFLDQADGEDYFESKFTIHGKEFLLRLNVFEDHGFELILTDITAKEKTRRLKHEMTGNVAHELRTPVTSIRGFLEILLNSEMNEKKKRDYLERAYAQTTKLSELISDMSLLTKIDDKSEVVITGKVDVAKIIDGVWTETGAALQKNHITPRMSIPEGLMLRGNEGLIRSVFRNLTDNVVSHAGSGVDIIVEVTDVRDGMVYFSFADTGRGIADEHHLNRLFERFYRVDEGRTRDSGGSGLGLSIVKNVVRLLGGNISVRNRAGGGLEFRFTLPQAKA